MNPILDIILSSFVISGFSAFASYCINDLSTKNIMDKLVERGYRRKEKVTIEERKNPMYCLFKTSLIMGYNVLKALYLHFNVSKYFEQTSKILEDLRVITDEPYSPSKKKLENTSFIDPNEKITGISINTSEAEIIVNTKDQEENFELDSYIGKREYVYYNPCLVVNLTNGQLRIYDKCKERTEPLKLIITLPSSGIYNYLTIKNLYGDVKVDNVSATNLSVTTFDGNINTTVNETSSTNLTSYRGNIRSKLLGNKDDYYVFADTCFGTRSGLRNTESKGVVLPRGRVKKYKAYSVFGNVVTKN